MRMTVQQYLDLSFEWDPQKAAENLKNHRVSFRDAITIFGDPLAITFDDPDHSTAEQRWLTFGLSSKGRLLAVSHAERKSNIRLISARLAIRSERKIYEEG